MLKNYHVKIDNTFDNTFGVEYEDYKDLEELNNAKQPFQTYLNENKITDDRVGVGLVWVLK